MVILMDITKEIRSAIPTIRTADNIVLSWELIIKFTYSDFSRSYNKIVEIENPTKIASEFTQQELIGLFPTILDAVFTAQYDSYIQSLNNPIIEVNTEIVTNFDINSLS